MGEECMPLQLREIAAGIVRFEKADKLAVEPGAAVRVARKAGELEIESTR